MLWRSMKHASLIIDHRSKGAKTNIGGFLNLVNSINRYLSVLLYPGFLWFVFYRLTVQQQSNNVQQSPTTTQQQQRKPGYNRTDK